MSSPRPLAVGEHVVARWQPGRYFEGSVTDRGQTEVTVAWTDGSPPSNVRMSDAYALPGSTEGLGVGDFVLAKWRTGTRWYGATITSLNPKRVAVRYTDGLEGELAHDEVLRVGEETRRDVVLTDAAATGGAVAEREPRVLVPAGWRPTPGQRVAAVWRKSTWYTGLVVSVESDGVVVAWEDGSKPSPVPHHRVAPVPDGTGASAPVGARVLLAPRSGAVWTPAKVVGATPRGCEVELEDGTRRPVPRGTCLVFAPE